MEKHIQLSDQEFETQFADKSIDPSLFTHEAHLRLAWIHIKRYGIDKAIDHICTQIKVFATFHGDKEKYHIRVTAAAVRVVYHFVLKSKSENFNDFILESPRLKNNFKKLFDNHYSLDVFTSERAKKEFLHPDLAPFDEIESDLIR